MSDNDMSTELFTSTQSQASPTPVLNTTTTLSGGSNGWSSRDIGGSTATRRPIIITKAYSTDAEAQNRVLVDDNGSGALPSSALSSGRSSYRMSLYNKKAAAAKNGSVRSGSRRSINQRLLYNRSYSTEKSSLANSNSLLWPNTPLLSSSSGGIGLVLRDDGAIDWRRRSSARSIFDAEKKCLICRQASALSINPPSICSPSIMQALSMTINNAAATTTIVVGRPQYRSYPQRWFVLVTVCLLALSNATQWMSFMSLHDPAAAFYCPQLNANRTDDEARISIVVDGVNSTVIVPTDCDVEYWTSQIFQLVGVLTGIFGMYITDRYGIRVSCYCGSWLNFVGAVIRVASSMPQTPPDYRLIILYTGQTVAASAQPFFLCLSPKVAEYWFSEHQRTFANALSFIANPFGVVFGSATPVLFVSKEPTTSNSQEIFWVNACVLSLATLVVLMNFGVRTSRPPTPPSASSDCTHKPSFFEGLIILFRMPIFYIQMITFGMAFAIEWAFFITADKMLSRLNYKDTVIGFLLSLSALSGSVASLVVGYCVDRSKKFKETIKFLYFGIALVAVAINVYLRHSRQSALDVCVVVTLLMALGFFSIPVFPISLELGVETTFPVAEATSSGILVIAGQSLLFLLALGMQTFESLDNWLYTTENPSENYQLSIDLWAIATVMSALFACIFLRPRYHRMEYEENAIVFSNVQPPLPPSTSMPTSQSVEAEQQQKNVSDE